MKIIVLGSGCASCDTIYSTVQEAVKELALDTEVSKENDLSKVMEYNIRTLPAIVIDGKVVAKGKLSSKDIKELLSRYK